MPDEIPPLPPPGVGLINTAPGLTTATPNTAAPPSGAPVTGYNPAAATATAASTAPFTVANKATVQGQLKEILASGSPLLEEAEANARQAMAGRGLINSSIALSAGRKALYDVALPIAGADAATWDRAATNTTATENQVRQFNAANETDVSKTNAGQTNAALSQAAQASNQVALTEQQGKIQKDLTTLQGDVQKELERIRGDITLSVADKDAAARQQIANLQAATSQQVAQLQANTSLTEQQRAIEANRLLTEQQGVINKELERIRGDISMSLAEKDAATRLLMSQGNNETAKAVQLLQNAGALQNIQANGAVSADLANIDGRWKALIQNSAGAAQIWSNGLQFMNNVVMNPDINPEQKTEYLRNKVLEINDALEMQSRIAGTPAVSSLLDYSIVGNDQGGGSARGTLTPAPTPTPTPTPANDNAAREAAIRNAYQATLGRPADQAGLDYWMNSGMSPTQIAAAMQQSVEYKQRTGT